MTIKVSIIGLGFVGYSMLKCFIDKAKDSNEYSFIGYDKYRSKDSYDSYVQPNIKDSLEECLNTDIMFTALPTRYDESLKSYDNEPTYQVMETLANNNYKGTIVIKSTIEPLETYKLSEKYPELNLVHNPEFLTARTAYQDCYNQSHIVLGKHDNCQEAAIDKVVELYKTLWPDAKISCCTSTESECMKIYCNTFYAIKVQYFNELYEMVKKLKEHDRVDVEFDNIVELMLSNNWINPMHTKVPGPDGLPSYGGLCFPKDTNALLQAMKKLDSPHKILEACVEERNEMRNDHDNCVKR